MPPIFKRVSDGQLRYRPAGVDTQVRVALASDVSGLLPAANLVGTDIATLGTVTAGVWNAGSVTCTAFVANAAAVTVNDTGGSPVFLFRVSGVTKGIIGTQVAGGYITGSAVNSMLLRSEGFGIDFSVDSGGSRALAITSAGVLDVLTGQIKFPATQNASSNANTLDDYEEGTWTPTDASGAGLTITVTSASYVKVGQLVYVTFEIQYPVTASGAAAAIGGLPFTTSANRGGFIPGYTAGLGSTPLWLTAGSATTFAFYTNAGATYSNANVSTITFVGSGVYRAAA